MYFQSATTSAPGKETLAVAEVNFSPYLKGNSNVSSIRDDDYAVHLHADADLLSFFHFHKFAWYLSGTFKNAAGLWSLLLARSKQSDGFTAKCPSFDFARSHLEKKADITTPL